MPKSAACEKISQALPDSCWQSRELISAGGGESALQELRFPVRQTHFFGSGGVGVGAQEMPYPASLVAQ